MEELCQQKVETLTPTCRLTATSLGVPSGTQGRHAQNHTCSRQPPPLQGQVCTR